MLAEKLGLREAAGEYKVGQTLRRMRWTPHFWYVAALTLPLITGCQRPAPPLTGKEASEGFSCLATASRTRIHIQLGHRGSFGGSDSLLDASVRSSSGASISGTLWIDPGRSKRVKLGRISSADGRQYIGKLVAAYSKGETKDGCKSSARSFARIHYWCDGRKAGPVMVESDGCDPLPIVSTAEGILRSLPGDQEDDGPQEKARVARMWGSLYKDGLRVRHDPIEEWRDP